LPGNSGGGPADVGSESPLDRALAENLNTLVHDSMILSWPRWNWVGMSRKVKKSRQNPFSGQLGFAASSAAGREETEPNERPFA
jgi:hypothetical protein